MFSDFLDKTAVEFLRIEIKTKDSEVYSGRNFDRVSR